MTAVTVKRGSLYLSRVIYDRYFAGLESVVLLRRGERLAILPVLHAAAGGYVLKRRNSGGDRVVTAPDFFRAHGVSDDREVELGVAWSQADSALLTTALFDLQT